MTTASVNNSFIQNGMLYIVPTLTSDNIGTAAVLDGAVYNITGCTFNITSPNNGSVNGVFNEAGYLAACSAVSNTTLGTVINPVQSARLSTRNSASIRYGRVEIRAKMPNGWVPFFLFLCPFRHDILTFFFFLLKQGLGGWPLEIMWNRNHLTPDVLSIWSYGPHCGCCQQRTYTAHGHWVVMTKLHNLQATWVTSTPQVKSILSNLVETVSNTQRSTSPNFPPYKH